MSKGTTTFTHSALQPLFRTDTLQPEEILTQFLAAPPALLAREDALLTQAERAGCTLTFVGTMPLFDGYRLYSGASSDWCLLNLADDPLMRATDGYPMAQATLQRLRRLRQIGVAVDTLVVAHELPKGRIEPGEHLRAEHLVPAPARGARRRAAVLGVAASLLARSALAPALGLGLLGAGALTAAAQFGVAAGTAVVLDPVLFGAIVAPGRPVRAGELARWLYLDHWYYDSEEEAA